MADKWDNYHADFGPLYSFLENVFHKLSRKDVAAACIVAFFASSLLFFFEKAFRSIKMQQATLAPIVPDHLYLSSMMAARDRDLLVQQRIEHIINATSDLENTFALDGRFSYHTCPLDDDPEEDLIPHLDPAHVIIEQAGREGKRVLVHCRAGRSRSASIVISYLMKKKGMTLKEAYLLVKEQKPDIRPNEGYLKQLQTLDKEIHGAVSFDLLAFNTEVIVGMGFSQEQAAKALRECDGDLDLAINRLFWMDSK